MANKWPKTTCTMCLTPKLNALFAPSELTSGKRCLKCTAQYRKDHKEKNLVPSLETYRTFVVAQFRKV